MELNQIEPVYLYSNKWMIPAGKTMDIIFEVNGEYRTFEEIKWGRQNDFEGNSQRGDGEGAYSTVHSASDKPDKVAGASR